MTAAIAVRFLLAAVLGVIAFAIVFDTPPPDVAWLAVIAAFLGGYFFADAESRLHPEPEYVVNVTHAPDDAGRHQVIMSETVHRLRARQAYNGKPTLLPYGLHLHVYRTPDAVIRARQRLEGKP